MATGMHEAAANTMTNLRLLDGIWIDAGEREKVSELLHDACLAQHGVVLDRTDDSEADLGPILNFVESLNMLLRLARAFRNNQGASLTVIARGLRLTRNGLYFRLEMVGLDPDDLRSDTPLPDLVQQSAKMRQHREAIQPFINRHRDSLKYKSKPR